MNCEAAADLGHGEAEGGAQHLGLPGPGLSDKLDRDLQHPGLLHLLPLLAARDNQVPELVNVAILFVTSAFFNPWLYDFSIGGCL